MSAADPTSPLILFTIRQTEPLGLGFQFLPMSRAQYRADDSAVGTAGATRLRRETPDSSFSSEFRSIGYLSHTDHLVAAIGLGSQRAISVEAEFSISAIVNRLRDDAAEEVSVTCNGHRGIRSIYDGILRSITPNTHRAGAAVVDLKVVRYKCGIRDALAGDTQGIGAG